MKTSIILLFFILGCAVSKKGFATRYWDCCKPHCSWPMNSEYRAKMCDVEGKKVLDYETYMCDHESDKFIELVMDMAGDPPNNEAKKLLMPRRRLAIVRCALI